MTPKRPSLVRPTAVAMSLPRGLPTACPHFGVPPLGMLLPAAGTGVGPLGVAAALAAKLCDRPPANMGPAASAASPNFSRPRRESPRAGGCSAAPEYGHPPPLGSDGASSVRRPEKGHVAMNVTWFRSGGVGVALRPRSGPMS